MNRPQNGFDASQIVSIEEPKNALKRFRVILYLIIPTYGVYPSIILVIAVKSKNSFSLITLIKISNFRNIIIFDTLTNKIHFKMSNAKKRLSNVFFKMDENHDGKVTMEELKRSQEKDGFQWDKSDEKMFNKMDKDKTGSISLEGNFLSKFSFIRFRNCFSGFLFPEWLAAWGPQRKNSLASQSSVDSNA